MPGPKRSIFATNKGTAAKRILTWGGAAVVVFMVGNHLIGGKTEVAPTASTTVLGGDASHYGVAAGGMPDADDSELEAKKSDGGVLSTEDKQKKLIVAAYPANPFHGASAAASGPEGATRLSINVGSGADSSESADTQSPGSPTTSASNDSAAPSSSADSSSSADDPSASSAASTDAAAPTSNPFDGLPDGDGTGTSQSDAESSNGPQSADDKAAASAAVNFITKYTNYNAASTTAEQFTQSLPPQTPDTRQEITSQTTSQWDRLARDRRVSEGKAVGKPSLTVPAKDGKAVVVVEMSISERGQTTNDSYRSRYTVTMVQSNNEWLVDGVTAQDN